MRDYERFSKELHSLSQLSEEAEKVLKEPDTVGPPDISSVLEHMEKLKVKIVDHFPVKLLGCINTSEHSHIYVSIDPNVKAE